MKAIRLARAEDSDSLLEIYGQYIDTAITFECVLPTGRQFAQRISGIAEAYPYLVCEEAGRILGYAYAHRQMEREAYQWNAELSVYLDRAAVSNGVGKALYGALIDILRLQGIRTVYGLVTVPNEKSERLHLSLGFRRMGTCRSAGYKCGAWQDVAWFEKQIAPYPPEPAPILPVGRIAKEKLEALLEAAARRIP